MTTTLVLGMLSGLSIGLLAVGLVLIFKANRFINLAHGQLGAVSAALLAKLVTDMGWSWWVAFPSAIAVGVAMGVVVERLVIRPLRARSSGHVSLLLATVGVAQLLLALTYVEALQPDRLQLQQVGYPVPTDARLRIAGVILDGPYLLIAVSVPLVIGVLAAFLQYSRMGKQIRAAASNPDAARLCGISLSRVNRTSWGIAGGLSALAAILQAPSQPSFNAEALGPGLLLRALGAAALGGFVSVPVALAGALAIGVSEHVALHAWRDGSAAELVVFAVIVAILLLRGRAIGAAAGITDSGGPPALRPTRIPAAVKDRSLVRRHRLYLGLAGLLVGSLLPLLPYFQPEHRRFLLVLVVIYAIVGVAITMLVGWAGQVSLGHFALIGVGAYMAARLAPHGWSVPVLLVVAGAVGAGITMIIGLPALRLRGLTLSVTTLGLAVVGPTWLFRQSWFGSPQQAGVTVERPALLRGVAPPTSQLSVYYLSIGVLIVVLLAAAALQRSVPGRLVAAVRDNEAAAAAFGVAPATVKLGMLAVSGFVAAMAGVLWALAWGNVAATQFAPQLSLSIVAVPVVGGLGSLAGAVVGAAVLYLPIFFLSSAFAGLFGDFGHQIGFQLALGGLALVGTLLAYPRGIAGATQHGWEAALARLARAAPRAGTGAESAPPEPMAAVEPPRRCPRRAGIPLVVEGVHRSFGGIRALDGVEVSVGAGEIVGLIGPNGAGKSTLLDAISGMVQPAEGTVRLFGEELGNRPPQDRAKRGLGRSFQAANLFGGLTVQETIQVALARGDRVGLASALVGAPWARHVDRQSRRRAAAIIERFGLSAYATTLTSELSTGSRRICELAAQVAARPSVLVLDEPTAGVAQRDAEAFGPLLRRIRDELDCSILIVEHDMPLLMGLCDRVYAMETGRVIAEGPPAEIRRDPAVIASYLGTDERAVARSGASAGGRGDGESTPAAGPAEMRST